MSKPINNYTEAYLNFMGNELAKVENGQKSDLEYTLSFDEDIAFDLGRKVSEEEQLWYEKCRQEKEAKYSKIQKYVMFISTALGTIFGGVFYNLNPSPNFSSSVIFPCLTIGAAAGSHLGCILLGMADDLIQGIIGKGSIEKFAEPVIKYKDLD